MVISRAVSQAYNESAENVSVSAVKTKLISEMQFRTMAM